MKKCFQKINGHKKIFILALIILLPSIVRVANYSPLRIHGDDLITAYFSAHYDFTSNNFFEPVPTNKVEWVCQFPSAFFVLQKLFFLVFGESLLSVKLSVIPYILIVSLFLFLLAKRLFNKTTAVISLIVYSFLAISLYHETLGLHFISSTAAFIVFFYLLIMSLKNESRLIAVLTGISCGFCYLFYASSYLAFPLLLFVFALQFFKKRSGKVVRNFLLSVLGFVFVISPFVLNMTKQNNYYLIGRAKQVNLINGEWSNTKSRLNNREKLSLIIKENLFLSLKSLYKDGVGGAGGYSFGHLAFFEKTSFSLFLFGLAITVFLSIKNIEMFILLSVLILTFIAGAILTIPPPPYHRLSLIFPFISIIVSFPFSFIWSYKKIKTWIKRSVVVVFLAFFCFNNEKYFLKSTKTENDNMNLSLVKYISENFPARKIYVASFPGYIFEKIYYFVTNDKDPAKIETGYHIDLLNKFNVEEKYLYVILFPDSFNEKFRQKDPQGIIYNFSQEYSLFYN